MKLRDCRLPIVWLAAIVAAVGLASSSADAKDYRLDYGVEMRSESDGGSVVCPYGRCIVKIESLKLALNISLFRGRGSGATIELEGEPGCCFFEGGGRSREVVPSAEVEKLRIFVGLPGRGLLYVRNQHVGNLYLRFHFDLTE